MIKKISQVHSRYDAGEADIFMIISSTEAIEELTAY